jgi:hypothetical protein
LVLQVNPLLVPRIQLIVQKRYIPNMSFNMLLFVSLFEFMSHDRTLFDIGIHVTVSHDLTLLLFPHTVPGTHFLPFEWYTWVGTFKLHWSQTFVRTDVVSRCLVRFSWWGSVRVVFFTQ